MQAIVLMNVKCAKRDSLWHAIWELISKHMKNPKVKSVKDAVVNSRLPLGWSLSVAAMSVTTTAMGFHYCAINSNKLFSSILHIHIYMYMYTIIYFVYKPIAQYVISNVITHFMISLSLLILLLLLLLLFPSKYF